MDNTKQYLQEKMQPFIELLFQQYLPEDDFRSIHDLFNEQRFYNFLMCILSQQTKEKIEDLELLKDCDGNMSYNQMRINNFQKILLIIQNAFDFLGLSLRRKISGPQIKSMVQNYNIKVLSYFMDYVYQLFKYNKLMVQFITTLTSQMQDSILQVMRNADFGVLEPQQFKSQNSIGSLQANSKLLNHGNQNLGSIVKLQELQRHLQTKEQQIKQIKAQKHILEEQLEQLQKQIVRKDQQIEKFKNRILIYEQIDQLMQQKDDQILKLTRKVAQIQLKSRSKQYQLTNVIESLDQKITEIQFKDAEIIKKHQKLKQILESLNVQKQQAQILMKKVINNLKGKNKLLSERNNELQKQLNEAVFEKQLKDKQLIEVRKSDQVANQNLGLDTLDINSPANVIRGQQFLEDIQSTTGNYSKLGEQLSVVLERTQFEDQLGYLLMPAHENNKRFAQLLQQNYSLKQEINLHHSKNIQSKQLRDQTEKMKMKIVILKRRNDEIDKQRKEEIDIMISAMEQCYYNSFRVAPRK